VRFRSTVEGFDVLPGAEVDLPGELKGTVLPPGRYEMEAVIRVGKRSLRLERPLELFGPNEVATTRAEITSFEPPRAEEGEEVGVAVGYRNTGNVTFRPRAELRVGGLDGAIALDAAEVEAGATGEATGSVPIEGTRSRQLTVRLLAGDRELDMTTVTVTPSARRSLGDRAGDWIAENAVVVVAVLLGLVLAMGALLAALVLRRRRGGVG
jgi:hypothetical protein